MLRAGSWIAFSVLALSIPVAALAKPLGVEACTELKQQRDALVSAGVRDALREPPAAGEPAERVQQAKQLIDVEGQLRFRCATDLPIPTLRPDQIVELPDQIEGEPRAKEAAKNGLKVAAPHAAAKTRHKKAPAAETGGIAAADSSSAGAPAQPARRKRTAETGVAPKPHPKPTTDDAYRPSSDDGAPKSAQ